MDWLKLILACVRALGAFATWANNKQLLAAGGRQAIAAALRAQADDIQIAKAVRADVRAAARRDPAGVLRDDDGFKRK